jgi:hypothetical protein
MSGRQSAQQQLVCCVYVIKGGGDWVLLSQLISCTMLFLFRALMTLFEARQHLLLELADQEPTRNRSMLAA